MLSRSIPYFPTPETESIERTNEKRNHEVSRIQQRQGVVVVYDMRGIRHHQSKEIQKSCGQRATQIPMYSCTSQPYVSARLLLLKQKKK